MSKFLRKLIGLPQQPVPEVSEEQTEEEQPPYLFVVNMGMLPNGDVNIMMRWNNKENADELARLTGHLMYRLNNGDYTETFLAILRQYSENNILSEPFVTSIMNAWKTDLAELGKKPAIRPLYALKQGIAE